ncbi:o-succinylbenzoate--CoA ligase [Pelagibaculum spongiae]|nr:o-succinylbenzoate--CoA ligase [Pelagibaculum spongiae]
MTDWTGCPLYQHALSRPDETAILADGYAISWLQLYQNVCGIALQVEQQVLPETPIAVVSENSLKMLLLSLASLHCGRIFFPINPAFPDQKIIDLCQKMGVKQLWSAETSRLDSFSGDKVNIDFEVRAEIESENEVAPQVSIDAPASLILTSGSSGSPKAVLHSIGHHLASAMGSRKVLPLKQQDHWLASLPLFHIGGYALVARCIVASATIVLDSFKTPLPELLARYPINYLSLVNTQLFRLLQQQPKLPERQMRVLLGGGPVSDDLLDQLKNYPQIEAFTSYGLTEMASQVCSGRAKAGLSGQLLPGRQMRLADDGEILLKGDTLFAGYWSKGQLDPACDEQGWFHTNDLGQLENGWLKVLGRKDQMLISGGENIQPQKIEQCLLSLSGVVQAVVVGVSHQQWGQRPVAFIQWADQEKQLSQADLIIQLKPQLANFMLPDVFLPWPEQMTGMKPDRKALAVIAESLQASNCKQQQS